LTTHKPKKHLGQNFLHDKNIIGRIVTAISPTKEDHIVEIGPGLGALTTPLAETPKRFDIIEQDIDLIPGLKKKYAAYTNITVHHADALSFDFATLTQKPHSLRLVGNLPYNISTPLIFHLLKFAPFVSDMHFMLQKEVVDRMAASAGDAAYGRLSVMVQYAAEVCDLFSVPPEAFKPKPKVHSSVVRLLPHLTLPHPATDESVFAEVVKSAFGQRRKMLRNTLKKLIDSETLTSLGIDPSTRAEQLAVEDFVKISNICTQQTQGPSTC